MKALKSALAKAILSSPTDKVKLRSYMAAMGRAKKSPDTLFDNTSQVLIVTNQDGQSISVRPVVVPKAV
ncbi:hypothetical protein [Actimicrobium sp. CCI2.3]|uniref:hypothetical protein n=1 Tax=Actimicrobium sp. CCI2.3 TaxID=3048616 RepID=UPI002AB36C63|nr:hypothetical protein [Actimicrobium sp. CCI2.3]MDY7574487.1 hypothetical protein [Actimicrobium sp. CCI2.3]MEB0023914.1 hypothetical protein [Actimicrobium sp. CCI2.3]